MKKYFFEIDDGVYVDDYNLDTALLFGEDHERIERYDTECVALFRIMIEEKWSYEKIITKICDLYDTYYNTPNEIIQKKYLYIWWKFCKVISPDEPRHFTYKYDISKVYTVDI